MAKTGIIVMLALAGTASAGRAQTAVTQPSSPATTAAIAFLDGVWIGPASFTRPDGKVERFEQMERVGPMSGGQVRIMEGKARGSDGKTLFNAVTVFSPAEGGGISMRSWTMGHEGARPLRIDPAGGFSWETQAGPARMRYTATVRDGVWEEWGDRLTPDGKAVRFFEMRLKRVGGTDWPAANPAFPSTP